MKPSPGEPAATTATTNVGDDDEAGQVLPTTLRNQIVQAWHDADTGLDAQPDNSPDRTFVRAQFILEIVETIGEQVRHDGMPRAEYEALESLIDDIIDQVSVLALRSKKANIAV